MKDSSKQSPSRPSKNRRFDPRGRHAHKARQDRRKKLAVTTRGVVEHLDLGLRDASYILFDLETTGGNPDRNGITEICALRFYHGEITDRFYSLVNPGISIPPIVRKMTGITNQMVKDAPRIDEVMPSFVEFIGNDILVSHNTIGDMKFLRHFARETTGKTLTNYYLCTHLLVEKLVPGAPDKSLKGLGQYFELAAGARLHRAEADAHLTLALFGKLLDLMEERAIPSVLEAIRFQGDFESASRLGWGVSEEHLTGVPSRPGTFYLYDYRGEVTFFASTHNLAQEVNRLKRFGDLPRQLVKLVLSSTEFKYEETDSHFAAMLQEIESLKNHKLRYEPENWHQRIASFLYLEREGEGLRLSIGPLSAGAVFAMGPVLGNREAFQFVDEVARTLGKSSGRRGVILSKEESVSLTRILTPDKSGKTPWWKALWARLFGAKRPKIESRLASLRIPNGLRPLGEHSGILVIPLRNGWSLYAVNSGMVVKEIAVNEEIDAVLRDDGLLMSLYQALKAPLPSGPLSALHAASANRLAWWIHFGVRRERGRFIPLAELDERFGPGARP